MTAIWIFFSLLGTPSLDRIPKIQTEPIPSYNRLFMQDHGWTGGDGAYTVPLGSDTTLWLFSDTWIGDIRDGRHVQSTMVNNSVALQVGKNPATARVDFFWGRDRNGEPDALIQPQEGERGWFWLFDGLLTTHGLFVFLMQIVPHDKAFDHIGAWLGKVANPRDPPDRWRIEQRKIPWGRLDGPAKILFGSALCQVGRFVYVYGTDEDITHGGIHKKYMIAARVAADSLDDFTRWRFFDGTRWQPDWTKAARLSPDMANEYSVSFQSTLNSYVVVYTEGGLSEYIAIRTAPSPEGPWSKPIRVFRCSESRWKRGVICYAAKAHPSLSDDPDELIVTYVAGSFSIWILATDAQLYWPRFLRLRFEKR